MIIPYYTIAVITGLILYWIHTSDMPLIEKARLLNIILKEKKEELDG